MHRQATLNQATLMDSGKYNDSDSRHIIAYMNALADVKGSDIDAFHLDNDPMTFAEDALKLRGLIEQGWTVGLQNMITQNLMDGLGIKSVKDLSEYIDKENGIAPFKSTVELLADIASEGTVGHIERLVGKRPEGMPKNVYENLLSGIAAIVSYEREIYNLDPDYEVSQLSRELNLNEVVQKLKDLKVSEEANPSKAVKEAYSQNMEKVSMLQNAFYNLQKTFSIDAIGKRWKMPETARALKGLHAILQSKTTEGAYYANRIISHPTFPILQKQYKNLLGELVLWA